MIKFDLPWPKTGNHNYMPRGGRLIKTPARREYDALIDQWAWSNRSKLREALALAESTQFLGMHLLFCGPASKYLTKDGRSKKLDLSNRIKSIEDAFCRVAGFDDCKIWELKLRKLIVPSSEYVQLKLFDLNDPEV